MKGTQMTRIEWIYADKMKTGKIQILQSRINPFLIRPTRVIRVQCIC
jgi:hypothetical protein